MKIGFKMQLKCIKQWYLFKVGDVWCVGRKIGAQLREQGFTPRLICNA
jgi:hypothetical protein